MQLVRFDCPWPLPFLSQGRAATNDDLAVICKNSPVYYTGCVTQTTLTQQQGRVGTGAG